MKISYIINSKTDCPRSTDLMFEQCGFDVYKLIEHFKRLHINYGNEFRSPIILEEILYKHPLWEIAKSYLDKGIHCPLEDITEEERKYGIDDVIERGNHNTGKKNEKKLIELVSKGIKCGYQIPVTVGTANNVKEGKSLNKKTPSEKLPPLIYGHCLMRTVHYIHTLRWTHPGKKIVVVNYDIKPAYRRGSLGG
eukprot:14902757-Ditylum_brightwellii.AAC.1